MAIVLGRKGGGSGGGGGGSVNEITSTDNSVTITDPSGPTVDLSVSGGSLPDDWTTDATTLEANGGTLDMGGGTIDNLGTGVGEDNAATVGQLDAVAESISPLIAESVIRTAAGVPSGAPDPDDLELPFAYDTTAITGGFYYWNGSAWVKIATIL